MFIHTEKKINKQNKQNKQNKINVISNQLHQAYFIVKDSYY